MIDQEDSKDYIKEKTGEILRSPTIIKGRNRAYTESGTDEL